MGRQRSRHALKLAARWGERPSPTEDRVGYFRWRRDREALGLSTTKRPSRSALKHLARWCARPVPSEDPKGYAAWRKARLALGLRTKGTPSQRARLRREGKL